MVKPSFDSGSLTPLQTRGTNDAVLDALRDAILKGQLTPGSRLKEEELAAALGTSRTPIRRAIPILEKEGLVELLTNRGARVRAYDTAELDDLYEMRALLESRAASRAAARTTEAAVQQLRLSCGRFEQLHQDGDVSGAVEENARFHNLILDLSSSDRLKTMVNSLIVLPIVYRAYVWFNVDQRLSAEQHHRNITEAIAAGDSVRAAREMERHDLHAREVLLSVAGDDIDLTAMTPSGLAPA